MNNKGFEQPIDFNLYTHWFEGHNSSTFKLTKPE